jgi:preprotein translocase subunit YajC
VNDDNTTIQLEINPGSYMKIEKSAISLEWSQALNKPVAAITETK